MFPINRFKCMSGKENILGTSRTYIDISPWFMVPIWADNTVPFLHWIPSPLPCCTTELSLYLPVSLIALGSCNYSIWACLHQYELRSQQQFLLNYYKPGYNSTGRTGAKQKTTLGHVLEQLLPTSFGGPWGFCCISTLCRMYTAQCCFKCFSQCTQQSIMSVGIDTWSLLCISSSCELRGKCQE